MQRCTRSTVKRDGFKAGSFAELPMVPKKKKPRTKPIPMVMETPEEEQAQGLAQEEMPAVPPTPIKIIQDIGADLQIDPALLTEEKLMAASSSNLASDVNDHV